MSNEKLVTFSIYDQSFRATQAEHDEIFKLWEEAEYWQKMKRFESHWADDSLKKAWEHHINNFAGEAIALAMEYDWKHRRNADYWRCC